MDTTSSALSRILQLLTENPAVQDKLRAELTEATANGDLNYDNLNALPYLEAVVRETLRLCVFSQFIEDILIYIISQTSSSCICQSNVSSSS